MKKFIASRISRNNTLFPPEITLLDDVIIIKCPGFFSGQSTSIPYDNISYLNSTTPLIGFSTLSIFVHGVEITIHGFTKSEVNEIKKTITEKQTS